MGDIIGSGFLGSFNFDSLVMLGLKRGIPFEKLLNPMVTKHFRIVVVAIRAEQS